MRIRERLATMGETTQRGFSMPRTTLLALAMLVAALATTAVASAATPGASVLIRHQVRGCHAWAVNGGAFAARHSLTLRAGASVTFTDNDVMPHQLIELSGPRVAMHKTAGMMGHMGATTAVTLSKPGIYRFGTKPGEDYMSGYKTTGPDNVLRLTITVK